MKEVFFSQCLNHFVKFLKVVGMGHQVAVSYHIDPYLDIVDEFSLISCANNIFGSNTNE